MLCNIRCVRTIVMFPLRWVSFYEVYVSLPTHTANINLQDWWALTITSGEKNSFNLCSGCNKTNLKLADGFSTCCILASFGTCCILANWKALLAFGITIFLLLHFHRIHKTWYIIRFYIFLAIYVCSTFQEKNAVDYGFCATYCSKWTVCSAVWW